MELPIHFFLLYKNEKVVVKNCKIIAKIMSSNFQDRDTQPIPGLCLNDPSFSLRRS